MKKLYGLVICPRSLTPALVAQEHYTEGPGVAGSIDSREARADRRLPQQPAPIGEAVDRRREAPGCDHGLQNLPQRDQEPSRRLDIAVAIEYKNHAAMDGLAAKGEAARDQILGGKQAAQQRGEKRAEIREAVTSQLLGEIFLQQAIVLRRGRGDPRLTEIQYSHVLIGIARVRMRPRGTAHDPSLLL